MQETQVWSLGREDPLEKEMATNSSSLAWRIPWREEPGRLQSMGSQRVRHDWATSLTHSLTGNVCYVLSHFSRVWLFITPWAVTCQAPLSMGFSRQEYWSGLPCPLPGDPPHPGIKLVSFKSPPLAGGLFTTSATIGNSRAYFSGGKKKEVSVFLGRMSSYLQNR